MRSLATAQPIGDNPGMFRDTHPTYAVAAGLLTATLTAMMLYEANYEIAWRFNVPSAGLFVSGFGGILVGLAFGATVASWPRPLPSSAIRRMVITTLTGLPSSRSLWTCSVA